jgi:hypothetical protein
LRMMGLASSAVAMRRDVATRADRLMGSSLADVQSPRLAMCHSARVDVGSNANPARISLELMRRAVYPVKRSTLRPLAKNDCYHAFISTNHLPMRWLAVWWRTATNASTYVNVPKALLLKKGFPA